jgi:hypothetical protein
MSYEDLAHINGVIEFIHKNKNCGLKESGKLDNFNLAETLALLEVVREEIINNI